MVERYRAEQTKPQLEEIAQRLRDLHCLERQIEAHLDQMKRPEERRRVLKPLERILDKRRYVWRG
jgi:hypothetical protein